MGGGDSPSKLERRNGSSNSGPGSAGWNQSAEGKLWGLHWAKIWSGLPQLSEEENTIRYDREKYQQNLSLTRPLSSVAWTEPALHHRPDDFQLSHHMAHSSNCFWSDVSKHQSHWFSFKTLKRHPATLRDKANTHGVTWKVTSDPVSHYFLFHSFTLTSLVSLSF